MKKILCILNILAMVLCLVFGIGIKIFIYNFICVGTLFSCISVIDSEPFCIKISGKQITLKKFCGIFLMVVFVLGCISALVLFEGINHSYSDPYNYYGSGMKIPVSILVFMLSILVPVLTIGIMLINVSAKSHSIYFKISHYLQLLLFVLLEITHFNYFITYKVSQEPSILTSSLSLSACALTLSGLVFLFNNKAIKISISVLSWAFVVLPIIYILRGYWGFPEEFITVLYIISVVIMLICSVVATIKEWNKNTIKIRK